jgi:hypothetical protein
LRFLIVFIWFSPLRTFTSCCRPLWVRRVKMYDHRSAYTEQESTYLFFLAVLSMVATSLSAVAL